MFVVSVGFPDLQGFGDHVVDLRGRFRFDADHAQIKGRLAAVVVHGQGVIRALLRPPRQGIQPLGQLAHVLGEFGRLLDQHQLRLPFPVAVPSDQFGCCEVEVFGEFHVRENVEGPQHLRDVLEFGEAGLVLQPAAGVHFHGRDGFPERPPTRRNSPPRSPGGGAGTDSVA